MVGGARRSVQTSVRSRAFRLDRLEDGMGSYICTDKAGEPKCEFKTMTLPKRDLIKFAANACTVIDDNGYSNNSSHLSMATGRKLDNFRFRLNN